MCLESKLEPPDERDNLMPRLVRLFGKKRGQRMTGWWLAGSVGEAFWFAAICVVSVLSLSTIVAWQVFSPETHPYPIGYGFWLLVLVSSIFACFGAIGFIIRVLRVAYSDEHRSVLADRAIANAQPGLGIQATVMPSIPNLSGFTDSPGVRLAFRLPSYRPELRVLVLGSIFVLAWDALVAVLVAITISKARYGVYDWFSIIVILPTFGFIGFLVTKWFFRKFRQETGIGGTTVEVSELPMIAGGSYQLHLVQYGRLSVKKLLIVLVCEEVATYHFGTDTRTERQEVYRHPVLEQGRCRIDWGKPFEAVCDIHVPEDVMHSFQSPHNSVAWKILVEGEVNRWPSFCRSFPVVVYPRVASPRKSVLS